jgi:hypothetical protein
MFFFEKKEPKNFCDLACRLRRAYAPECQRPLLLFVLAEAG